MRCGTSAAFRSVIFGSAFSLLLGTHTAALAATPVVQQAIPAAAFLDSLGVNTHFNNVYGGDAYADVGKMEWEMKYAGFHYARDTIYQHWPLLTLQKVNRDTGIKFNIMPESADYASELNDIRNNPTLFSEIEGPNEIDNWPVTFGGLTGVLGAVLFQEQLYADIKGNAKTAALPVHSFTVSNNNYTGIGDISPYCNYSASHIYMQWGSNTSTAGAIGWSVAAAATDAKSRPPVVTEFGWWTKPMGSGVSYNAQAKYMLNFFMTAYKMGIHRSFVYELQDEYADSTNNNIERHFGLFSYNGSAKTSAVAMHNMTTILADPTPTATPGGIPYTVTTTTNVTINKLLFQRGDGVFVLALWQDPVLWDNIKHVDIAAPAQQALVNFGITASVTQVYDPMISTAPTYSNTNLAGLTQMVPDHPIFIFIKP